VDFVIRKFAESPFAIAAAVLTAIGSKSIPGSFAGGNVNLSLEEDLIGVSCRWKF
jgi:hypothetical protein